MEFLSSKGEDNEEIEDGSELKLGDAPMPPPLKIKNHQASKLGDAHGIPSSSSTIISSSSLNFIFYHFTYYVLCLERIFTFSFVCYFLVICLLDPCFICEGERHASLFHLNTHALRLYLVEYSYLLFVC